MKIFNLCLNEDELKDGLSRAMNALLIYANDQYLSIENARDLIADLGKLESNDIKDISLIKIIKTKDPGIKGEVLLEPKRHLNDLCVSCHYNYCDCDLTPGISKIIKGDITIECNKYDCVTMPKDPPIENNREKQ